MATCTLLLAGFTNLIDINAIGITICYTHTVLEHEIIHTFQTFLKWIANRAV
jgi:hypothetical protein